MKRRITLSIALVVSIVLVSLMSSDSMVKAQQQGRFFAYDSGIVSLGPNQALRVGVVNYRETDFNVRFRRMEYMQTVCSDGVCKQTISSQTTSAPITMMPGEAANLDVYGGNSGSMVRAVVMSNRRNARVTATIINTLTGETVSQIIMANTEGD